MTGVDDRSTLRPVTKKTTPDTIVDSATAALVARGYNGTGINDILAAVKVPKGSFYHYFESKEALAEEVLRRYGHDTEEWLTAQLAADGSPVEAVVKTFRAARERLRGAGFGVGCLLGSLAQELANSDGKLVSSMRTIFRAWERPLLGALERAKSQGLLTPDIDCRALASHILNSWEGAVLRSKLEKSAAPLDRFLDHTARYLRLLQPR